MLRFSVFGLQAPEKLRTLSLNWAPSSALRYLEGLPVGVTIAYPHPSGSRWSAMEGRDPQTPYTWFILFHVSGMDFPAPLKKCPQSRVRLPARSQNPFSPSPGPSPPRVRDGPVAATFEQTTAAHSPWGHHVQTVQTRALRFLRRLKSPGHVLSVSSWPVPWDDQGALPGGPQWCGAPPDSLRIPPSPVSELLERGSRRRDVAGSWPGIGHAD